jgi:hypothetical protein
MLPTPKVITNHGGFLTTATRFKAKEAKIPYQHVSPKAATIAELKERDECGHLGPGAYNWEEAFEASRYHHESLVGQSPPSRLQMRAAWQQWVPQLVSPKSVTVRSQTAAKAQNRTHRLSLTASSNPQHLPRPGTSGMAGPGISHPHFVFKSSQTRCHDHAKPKAFIPGPGGYNPPDTGLYGVTTPSIRLAQGKMTSVFVPNAHSTRVFYNTGEYPNIGPGSYNILNVTSASISTTNANTTHPVYPSSPVISSAFKSGNSRFFQPTQRHVNNNGPGSHTPHTYF